MVPGLLVVGQSEILPLQQPYLIQSRLPICSNRLLKNSSNLG